MELIQHSSSSEVLLEIEEAKTICGFGDGEKCCAFLTSGRDGLQCVRMSYPLNSAIFKKLENNTSTAKYEGGGEGCYWKDELDWFDGNVGEV